MAVAAAGAVLAVIRSSGRIIIARICPKLLPPLLSENFSHRVDRGGSGRGIARNQTSQAIMAPEATPWGGRPWITVLILIQIFIIFLTLDFFKKWSQSSTMEESRSFWTPPHYSAEGVYFNIKCQLGCHFFSGSLRGHCWWSPNSISTPLPSKSFRCRSSSLSLRRGKFLRRP